MDGLIDALKHLKVETGSLACLGCCHEHSCGTRGCAIIRAAIEELENRKWISVKDNPPEEGVTVLTLSRWKHIGDRTLQTFSGGVKLFAPDGLKPEKDITHWMPLPEQPEVIRHSVCQVQDNRD